MTNETLDQSNLSAQPDVNTDESEAQEDVPTTAAAVAELNEKANTTLHDLSNKITSLLIRVNTIHQLVDVDKFKLVSKRNRNSLMSGMIEESRDIEELAKVVFRTLKKIKRERIPEDEIDTLLGIPDSLKATKTEDQDTTE